MKLSGLVVLILLSAVPAVFAFDADDLIAQSNRHLWYVSEDIAPGDSFTYVICDNMMNMHATNHCHTIQMDFYIQMQSQNRNIWIIQAVISDGHESIPYIFLMDSDTLEISTNQSVRPFAISVENTLFYLNEFASVHHPKSLRVGSIWGDVSSLDIGSELIVSSHDTVEIQNGQTLDVSVLQYGFFEPSTFTISDGMPFPISGIMHDPNWISPKPRILATFELVDYLRSDAIYLEDGFD